MDDPTTPQTYELFWSLHKQLEREHIEFSQPILTMMISISRELAMIYEVMDQVFDHWDELDDDGDGP